MRKIIDTQKRLADAKRKVKKLNNELPPKCYAETSRHGRIYIYFEPGNGARKIRIKAEPASADFMLELAAAMKGTPLAASTPPPKKALPQRPTQHTWRWLCVEYFASDSFRKYDARGRQVRRAVLEGTFGEPINQESPLIFGDCPIADFETKAVITLRDRKLKWKSVVDDITGEKRDVRYNFEAANSRVRYMRQVFSWAIERHTNLVGGHNWAKEVALYKPENPDGHHTWSLEDQAKFERAYPLGTKARLIYDIALFTAQRRADIVRLGSQFIERDRKQHERLSFIQHKGRNNVSVRAFVPIFPELQASLNAAKIAGILGDMLYIVQGRRNKGYTDESLGNLFHQYVVDAGLTDRSLHGLRKSAVCRLITKDCSYFEIMAITGHRTRKEIERYGRDYMREMSSEKAFEKWMARHSDENFPEEQIAALERT